MPRAKLSVEVPEGTWIHAVSTARPVDRVRVVSVLSGSAGGVTVLELWTDEHAAQLAAIERHPDVAALDLLWTDGESTLLQVETSDPRLLFPLLEAGVPIETPFDVADGTATWEVTTSRERLSALGDGLSAAGISFETEYVRDSVRRHDEDVLTDRQRELLLAAADLGYYETPRRATLTDVADSIGVTKATASEILHRAEGAVIDRFLEDSPASTW